MAHVQGTAYIKVNPDGGGLVNLLKVTDCSLALTSMTDDVTDVFNDEFPSNILTGVDWSISGNGKLGSADSAMDALLAKIMAADGVDGIPVTFEADGMGDTYAANGIVDLTINNSGRRSAMTFSLSIKPGNPGTLTRTSS